MGGKGVEAVGCGYTHPYGGGSIIDQNICNCNSDKTILIDCDAVSPTFNGRL